MEHSSLADNNNLQKHGIVSSIISKILDEIIFDYDITKDIIHLYVKEDTGWNYFNVDNYIKFNKMKKSVHPDDFELLKNIFSPDEDSVKKNIDVRLRINPLKDTEYKWYRIHYSTIHSDFCRIVGRIIYIEEEKLKRDYISKSSRLDELTQLLNKDAFSSEVDSFIRNEGKNGHHAMLSIDIDNMGVINSVFGYVFADTIIRDAADAIKSVFRTTDLTARTGGDEFTVFIKNIGHDDAINKAGELCMKIRHKYKTHERTVEVTGSVAVTFFPEDGLYYDIMTKNLDTAMTIAKKTKNITVCFNNNMSENTRSHDIKSHIRYHSIQDYDIEFFAYAFSLMTNSMDINTSINMLLEQMGKHFDLSGIIVCENTDNKKGYITNKWDVDNGITEIDSNGSKKELLTENFSSLKYDDNDMICIDDINNNKDISLPNEFTDSIKSIVICRFNDNVINQGNISVYSDKKRKWTPFETGTFYEVSRLLSVFVTMRKRSINDANIIRKYAHYDSLTGLLKPDSFEERVQKKIENKPSDKAAAVIYADINNFSYINENFGYNQGDEILRELSEILLSLGSSIVAARPYSDYFIIYYESSSSQKILDEIVDKKNMWFEKQKKAYPAANLRISTGIYFIESNKDNVKLAIENANLARKYFKGNENIKYEVYTHELRSYKIYEQKICAELHDDIKDGYLELFLQPKFSLDNRTVIGAEALSRWRNKDGSYKFPNDFIPVLERVGYIVELDFYMYELVLKYMNKWKKSNKKLIPISINFSRIHNYYDDFVTRVIDLADKYEIDKSLIEIETTETAMFNNESVMLKNMEKLHDNGFLIDIDDFGTGFSSLNMIFTAPFDIVKVDKSILNKTIGDKDRKYIKRLIDLITDVEKEVLFEGVETEEQAELLLSCGCVKAQGWLFDKAIHIDEFEKKYL